MKVFAPIETDVAWIFSIFQGNKYSQHVDTREEDNTPAKQTCDQFTQSFVCVCVWAGGHYLCASLSVMPITIAN